MDLSQKSNKEHLVWIHIPSLFILLWLHQQEYKNLPCIFRHSSDAPEESAESNTSLAEQASKLKIFSLVVSYKLSKICTYDDLHVYYYDSLLTFPHSFPHISLPFLAYILLSFYRLSFLFIYCHTALCTACLLMHLLMHSRLTHHRLIYTVHGQGQAWLAWGLTQPNPKRAMVMPDFLWPGPACIGSRAKSESLAWPGPTWPCLRAYSKL